MAVASAVSLHGQAKPGETAWDRAVREIREARASDSLDRRAKIVSIIAFTGAGQGQKLFLDWTLSGRLRQLPSRKYVEEARTDKQLGATASNAGSTSLVSKG